MHRLLARIIFLMHNLSDKNIYNVHEDSHITSSDPINLVGYVTASLYVK